MTREDFLADWGTKWYREVYQYYGKLYDDEITPREERIGWLKGEVARQDAYIDELEAQLRKCRDAATPQEPMPPIPDCHSEIGLDGWRVDVETCLRAIYKAHGWKP